MNKPSPQAIVSELDWIFIYSDPNPLFMQAAELIKELYIENERLRSEKGFEPAPREFGQAPKWSE